MHTNVKLCFFTALKVRPFRLVSDPSLSWACRSHLQHLEAWMVCMCCSAWIKMSGLVVKCCWKWNVKKWKCITKWRCLGADHCWGRVALVLVALQNRTTQSNTHTPSWLRSEVEVCRWLMDGSVHLPASDGWSHPVHQLTVGFTDPLCRQETEKETHSSKNRKNWCNLCVWLKPKQWTMCIFLSAATSTSEAARLWFAGVLISCFLKSGSVLSAPARWLTQLLIPV